MRRVDRASAAYFDRTCDAWLLSRHADVLAALRDPRLTTCNHSPGASPRQRHASRRATQRVLFAGERRAQLEASARTLIAALPRGTPVELIANFARPWSLGLAGSMSGAAFEALPELSDLARVVFLDAAHATSPESTSAARAAVSELARRLPGDGTTLAVQAFVAISQTLPHLLASVWLALLQQPGAAEVLRKPPGLNAAAVDELLRAAGPSRAVFRIAREDVRIGNAEIRAGDAVVLRLAAANHDPQRFSAPERLDFSRTGAQLAFGHGTHRCPGAQLVRVSLAMMTTALLSSVEGIELEGDGEWIDGFAIRAPATLHVHLAKTSGLRA